MVQYAGHDPITGLYGRYLGHDFRYSVMACSHNGQTIYLSSTPKSLVSRWFWYLDSHCIYGEYGTSEHWTFMSGIQVKVGTLNHLNTRLLIQYYLVHS